jgi:hypothetical protein
MRPLGEPAIKLGTVPPNTHAFRERRTSAGRAPSLEMSQSMHLHLGDLHPIVILPGSRVNDARDSSQRGLHASPRR